jgi:hypothetical protein
VAGFLIGGFDNGMASAGDKWYGGFNFKPAIAPMIQMSGIFAVTSAVSEYGYKNNFDTKYFNGASNFLGKIGGTLTEAAFSYSLGGWGTMKPSGTSNVSRPVWLSRSEIENPSLYTMNNSQFSGAQISYTTFGDFRKKWVPLMGEGIGLLVSNYTEKNLGWDTSFTKSSGSVASSLFQRAFMPGKSFPLSIGEIALIGGIGGITSSGLQTLSKETTPLGPYTGAVVNLVLTDTLYSAFMPISPSSESSSRWDLAKSLFNANMRNASGGFLSGGLATLNQSGDL